MKTNSILHKYEHLFVGDVSLEDLQSLGDTHLEYGEGFELFLSWLDFLIENEFIWRINWFRCEGARISFDCKVYEHLDIEVSLWYGRREGLSGIWLACPFWLWRSGQYSIISDLRALSPSPLL